MLPSAICIVVSGFLDCFQASLSSGTLGKMQLAIQASTLQAARQQVASRSRSATELTQTYLRGLRSVEPRLRSFIAVDDEFALQQAARIDERLAKGEDVGPLAGVPIAIKVRGWCCRRRAATATLPPAAAKPLSVAHHLPCCTPPTCAAGQPVRPGTAHHCGQQAAAGLHADV